MTFEETIRDMFMYYPKLFPTKADCLDHLFLVIGNGYSWENGELVKGYEYKEEPELTDEDEIQKRMNDISFNPKHLYPYCPDYSKINNYPDDIKPDWLEAINLAKELFASHINKGA